MSAQALEILLTDNLRARDLARVPGRLAFLHKGQTVEIEIEESIYRGFSINLYDGSHNTLEFRPEFGTFNWNAIAQAVTRVAERRTTTSRDGQRASVFHRYQHQYAMS
jgi:hypothetical protein